MKTISIDLDDVFKAGDVERAIIAACERSELSLATAEHAMGGQTFATSGPGPGWSKTFGANDFALAAIRTDFLASGCGDPAACQAIDPETGRIASGVDADDDDAEIEIEWTDESCVELVTPDLGEAMEYPAEAALMARAVIDVHGDQSDRKEWGKLVRAIQDAAKEFADFDADQFDAE